MGRHSYIYFKNRDDVMTNPIAKVMQTVLDYTVLTKHDMSLIAHNDTVSLMFRSERQPKAIASVVSPKNGIPSFVITNI